jgi:hypothetical protein
MATTESLKRRVSQTAFRSAAGRPRAGDPFTWVLDELDCNGYVVIEGALDGPGLARLSSVVDAVWRSECPGGGELHRLAFVGLDTAFVELVDHPLTLPLVTAMSRICGPAPTPR